ncbi:MAG: lipid A deacylase LpxR family protein [Verrucomicrobia bacterium]|nr:lipid A deacylase LpxR family protein [Verrucomicrobiota bacterium]
MSAVGSRGRGVPPRRATLSAGTCATSSFVAHGHFPEGCAPSQPFNPIPAPTERRPPNRINPGIFAALLALVFLPLLSRASLAASDSPAPPPNSPPIFGSFTFYLENDKFFAGTDQHYTQGLRATWLSNDLSDFNDPVHEPIATFIAQRVRPFIDEHFPGVSVLRRGVSFGQNLYTPVDTRTAAYQPDDRPYAAWLYLGWAFHVLRDGDATHPARTSVFEITTGLVGPGALGEWAQNGWHDIIHVPHAEGWAHQLRNEPGLNLVWERKLRYSTDDTRRSHGPARRTFAADFIPHYGLSLGNVSTYANLGAEVRAGYRLPRDFGTPVIRPSADTAIERELNALGAHLFASIDARLVARDLFLDGNTFRSGPHVAKRPLVADWQAGLVLNYHRFKFAYSQAARTKEFYSQRRRQVFGSVSLTYSRPLELRR